MTLLASKFRTDTAPLSLPGVARTLAFRPVYLSEHAPRFIHSPKMQAIKKIIEEVADTDATVLVRGESGVGKEVVARAIHAASSRNDRPFVKVNCAALPAELLESELFGHERGAFTGAYRRKPGKFELAHTGTIFLDEIVEIDRSIQAKLLHVLQDREFYRVGGRELLRMDVRVIASTNRNLEAALSTGEFREDLYYRLNVVTIRIPPLRERSGEIPALVSYFLTRFNREYSRNVQCSSETIALLGEHSWPGNIRELENLIRRLVVLGDIQQVHEELLAHPRNIKPTSPNPPQLKETASSGDSCTGAGLGLREIALRAAREAEQKALAEVLDRVHWNRREAARILRISYKTLLNRIVEFWGTPRQSRES